MTDHTSNPFVLPGMGQGSGDTAGNPLLASMEMMRQAWAGLTGPGGLAQVMPLTPPMNLQDLERRIAELRAVESWLSMNLSMLSSTIQGLEVQRSTIATLRSFVDSMGAQAQDPASWAGASPLEIVLGLKPAPGQAAAARDAWPGANARSDANTRSGAEASSGADARSAERDAERDARAEEKPSTNTGASSSAAPGGSQDAPGGASSAGSAQAISQAAQSASEAWWGMLQQQFNQLANATAATMPGMPGGPASPGSTQGTTTGGAAAAAGSSAAPKAGAASAASKAGAAKKAPASSHSATPRKTAVRKNKIQSDPDQS